MSRKFWENRDKAIAALSEKVYQHGEEWIAVPTAELIALLDKLTEYDHIVGVHQNHAYTQDYYLTAMAQENSALIDKLVAITDENKDFWIKFASNSSGTTKFWEENKKLEVFGHRDWSNDVVCNQE